LVPLMPNEFTPASARSGYGHGASVACTRTGTSSQGIALLGVSKFSCGGSSRCFTASVALMSPATPEAGSAWPMFAFTEEMRSGRSFARPGPITSASARTSTGSPTLVPVPCASTKCTSLGAMPARS
jgi:hypothetical protein